MDSNFKIILSPETIENIELYSQILGKSTSDLIEEALQTYFSAIQAKIAQDNILDDNAQTNLGYDEFWDGVEL